MSEQLVATAPPAPFEDAAELRRVNASLLSAMDKRLGDDSSTERELVALQELESQIRAFLDRGSETGTLIEEVTERTACQVLLDYWSSTLSHAGIIVPRSRLAPFDADRLPTLSDDKCPYVGLESFRNGVYFFGRERAVRSLLERLNDEQLVVVQGGSGSGKSSLVMGGALPTLTAPEHVPQFRLVGPFTPGNAALKNLVGALNAANPDRHFDPKAEAEALRARPARLPEMLGGAAMTPCLLVIDQFEEIFTLCKADCAPMAAAIDALLRSCPACRVILTLREEFTNELDTLEPLRDYLDRHARFSMKEWPMGYDELRAAVERPAALVNLHFAPGIVDELVKSVLGQDTALPLLQFALQSLWKQRDHNRITRDIYQRVGSPLIALERYADGFYEGLSQENKDEAERILLELVRIDRLMEAYREPRMRSALETTPRSREMLDLLEQKDFLRITPAAGGDATVEVKHEALLRNWPRYVEWIDGKREATRRRLAVTAAAQRWEEQGRSPDTGLADDWLLKYAEDLTGLSQLEKDYLQASRDHADASRLAHERAMRQRQRVRWSAATAGLIVLAVGVVLLLWGIGAQTGRERSEVLAEFANATAASYRGEVDDAFIGVLKAGVKMTALPDRARAELRPQLREALLSTLQNASSLKRLFVKKEGTFNAVAFHPSRADRLIAFGGASDRHVYLASLAGDARLPTFQACDAQGVSALAFDPQGRFLVVGCRSGTLSVWSASDWRQIGEARQISKDFIRSLSVRRDGRLVAASGANNVALVQLDEQGAPAEPHNAVGEAHGGISSVAFSPTDDTLIAGDGEGYILACHTTGDQSWDCRPPQGYARAENDAILTLAFSSDGKQIAAGHYWRGVVDIWDAKVSEESRRTISHMSPSAVYSLAFFRACGRLQLAIGTDTGLEYSPVDEIPQGAPPLKPCARIRSAQIGDQTYSVAFDSRPGGTLVAATQAGYVAELDPSGSRDPIRSRMPPAGPIDAPHPLHARVPPTGSGKPMRGALLAEAGSTTWLALQNAPMDADPSNVAILRLHEGKVDGNFQLFTAGSGEIRRLSASPESRRLVAISCTTPPGDDNCGQDPYYEINVWEFTAQVDAPKQLIHLFTSPDPKTSDFRGGAPLRALLSPDGRWLVISFRNTADAPAAGQNPQQSLLIVPVDHPNAKQWIPIPSSLRLIKEIAFSEDGKMFAAGGCCGMKDTQKDESDLDQIWQWSVDEAGFKRMTAAPLTLSPLARNLQEVTFASDQKGHPWLLAGGLFGTIASWDLVTGEHHEVRVDTHGISFIAFNRRESLIAAAVGVQGVVRLWNTSNWDMSRSSPVQLTPPTDDPYTPGFLAFAGSGARLVASVEELDSWDLDPASLHRKVCTLLREVGKVEKDNTVDGDMPWHADRECKEGALTPPPRSVVERAWNFLTRASAALPLPGSKN
jgi:WD40 repeat protein